jgi:hypothetical protein
MMNPRSILPTDGMTDGYGQVLWICTKCFRPIEAYTEDPPPYCGCEGSWIKKTEVLKVTAQVLPGRNPIELALKMEYLDCVWDWTEAKEKYKRLHERVESGRT